MTPFRTQSSASTSLNLFRTWLSTALKAVSNLIRTSSTLWCSQSCSQFNMLNQSTWKLVLKPCQRWLLSWLRSLKPPRFSTKISTQRSLKTPWRWWLTTSTWVDSSFKEWLFSSWSKPLIAQIRLIPTCASSTKIISLTSWTQTKLSFRLRCLTRCFWCSQIWTRYKWKALYWRCSILPTTGVNSREPSETC